jgi:hypothetical protein
VFEIILKTVWKVWIWKRLKIKRKGKTSWPLTFQPGRTTGPTPFSRSGPGPHLPFSFSHNRWQADPICHIRLPSHVFPFPLLSRALQWIPSRLAASSTFPSSPRVPIKAMIPTQSIPFVTCRPPHQIPKRKVPKITQINHRERALIITTKNNRGKHIQTLRNHAESSIHETKVRTRSSKPPDHPSLSTRSLHEALLLVL